MVTPMRHAQSFPCSAKYQPASINRSSQGAVPAVAGRVRDMTTQYLKWAAFCVAAAACMPVALAHPSFETRSAAIGTSYKAVIKLPHGCDGSPTTRVRVQIPEGVIGVKPKPMPGWSIETKRGALRAVLQVLPWRRADRGREGDRLDRQAARRAISTSSYSPRFSPTAWRPERRCISRSIRTARRASHAWTDVPAPGQDAHALKSPAPGIALLPVADKATRRKRSRSARW